MSDDETDVQFAIGEYEDGTPRVVVSGLPIDSDGDLILALDDAALLGASLAAIVSEHLADDDEPGLVH